MEVVSNSFMPGDPRLIDRIVYELKSQGIFDNFRKECIADVDTKPAYQNLRQRVEGSVCGFLKTQKWRPDMNKNHVREMLRRNISESGFLETGVERIVDQVVNPKINSIFLPQVENIVYKYLGVQNPSAFDELKAQTNLQRYSGGGDRPDSGSNNLLPSDLEAVSPESEPQERKLDISGESQKLDDRIDEDESPPFEPLEENSFVMVDENSGDSHLSGFSGLASHDSNHSFEDSHKIAPMEISNQDSRLSKQSSDDHLSIVMSDETEIKMDEDSSHSKVSKTTDSNSKNFDFMQDSHSSGGDKSLQTPIAKTVQDKKSEEKKFERHRSSDKLDKHKSRHDSKSSESRDRKSEKDRRSEKDRKEHRDRSKHGSKDGKERKDSRSEKDGEGKTDKEQKYEKDRDKRKNSSSRHGSSKDKSGSKKDSSESKAKESKDSKIKEPEIKDSKTKETKLKDSSSSVPKESKPRDSKSRDDSKSKSGETSHSSSSKSKGDSKSHSKHNGKTKIDLSTSSTKPEEKINKKPDKHHSRSERHSSSSKKDDKRDSKKEMKKLTKDDHYSLKPKNTNRRSTDRDSSDGHSGTHSSSSSFADSSTSSQVQKSSQETSRINSSSGESGNSDEADQNTSVTETTSAMMEIHVNTSTSLDESTSQISPLQHLAPVKLIKPKFASNIFEARRLMKIRKKLGKIEKQNQRELINANAALNNANNGPNHITAYEMVTLPQEESASTLGNQSETNDNSRRRPNILKRQSPTKPSQVSRINASTKPRQIFRNRTKPVNHHKKKYENRKNSMEKSRKPESEEEIVAEVVEISETSISPPLISSVVSQESWDALEAKLNSQNILQVDYNSYTGPVGREEISVKESAKSETVTLEEDCLGFPPVSDEYTENYFRVIHAVMMRLNADVEMILKNQQLRKAAFNREKQAIAEEKEMEVINRRLPKVAIVDVTTDNEITISPTNKSIKRRRVNDHPDVHNNNKSTKQLKRDQLNHTKAKVNSPVITNAQPKAKKPKIVNSSANHVDNFNLPLSPAESDKSFTTPGDKKNEKEDAKPKRNSNTNKAANNLRNQRYSSDDLYKPRLQFSSSRRRAMKNSSEN